MGMGMSRFPDPYETRDDLSHATVFVVVILLLIGIAAILFFGNAWVFAPVNSNSILSIARGVAPASAASPAAVQAPQSPPSFIAPTPVPPLAGVPYRPTPNGTQTVTPTPSSTATNATPTPKAAQGAGAKPTTTPTPTKAPTSSPTPPGSPTPSHSPTPPSSPTSQPVGRVASTGGDGVYLRHTPNLSDRWVAWPDNTPLVILGGQANNDGEHWIQVRDPRGNVGWVPSRYVSQ